MSGPKSSRYYLSLEQQRKLEEERRIRQETERLHISIAQKSSCYLLKDEMLAVYAENMDSASENCGTDSSSLDALLLQLESITKEKKRLISSAENCNDLNALKGIYSSLENLQTQFHTITDQLQMLNQNNLDLITIHFGKIAAKQDVDYSYAMREYDTAFLTYKKAIKEKLEQFTSDTLSDDLQKLLQQASEQLEKCRDIPSIKNLDAVVIIPLKRKIAEFEEYHAQFIELSAMYQALTGDTAEMFSCDANGIALLKDAIKKAEEADAYADEQQYIRKCVDEVMRDMGYDVLAERDYTKRNGKSVHNSLVQFDGDTAISITQTDDGRITMELGALDDTDRIPDDSETNRLCEQMESFCDSYSEIERRLREKGVLTQHLQLLPPESAYAQIINCNDFGIAKPDFNSEYMPAQKHKTQRME